MLGNTRQGSIFFWGLKYLKTNVNVRMQQLFLCFLHFFFQNEIINFVKIIVIKNLPMAFVVKKMDMYMFD